jgi:hypothetical protein
MFINLVILAHTTQNNNSNFINQKVHWEIKATKKIIEQNTNQNMKETKQTTNQKLKVYFY